MNGWSKDIWALFLCIVYLCVNAVLDLYKRRISLSLTFVHTVLWLVFFMMFYYREGLLGNCLLGMLPGIFLILISICSKGNLGLGDGIVMIPIGLYLGIWDTSILLICAFGLAFVWSVILICFCKKQGKYNFPFVPFLFIGLIGMLIW